ncbi:MAG: GNAT family N-acetyltransferase [Bacteriovoracaceae bacterium]|nr:GNAT family N-acetyltransferase [Bacteriovoracaceae bacterium]
MRLELCDHTDPKIAQEIVEIVKKYYPDTAWPLTLEKLLQSKVKYYFAFDGDKKIGMSGIDFKTPTLAETVKTVVFKEFRGQGLGEKLSQAIEDECRSQGVKKVMSTIYTFNHVMVAIKLKQGYRIEGLHPDHEKEGFHEYSLGKKL